MPVKISLWWFPERFLTDCQKVQKRQMIIQLSKHVQTKFADPFRERGQTVLFTVRENSIGFFSLSKAQLIQFTNFRYDREIPRRFLNKPSFKTLYSTNQRRMASNCWQIREEKKDKLFSHVNLKFPRDLQMFSQKMAGQVTRDGN